MTLSLLLPKLFLAGSSVIAPMVAPAAPQQPILKLPDSVEMMNHTLAGEKIPAKDVVCRSQWGTPMPPDNKGGYSLIAPIKKHLIAQSLWIPPVSGKRPKLEGLRPVSLEIVVPAPSDTKTEAPAATTAAQPSI